MSGSCLEGNGPVQAIYCSIIVQKLPIGEKMGVYLPGNGWLLGFWIVIKRLKKHKKVHCSRTGTVLEEALSDHRDVVLMSRDRSLEKG